MVLLGIGIDTSSKSWAMCQIKWSLFLFGDLPLQFVGRPRACVDSIYVTAIKGIMPIKDTVFAPVSATQFCPLSYQLFECLYDRRSSATTLQPAIYRDRLLRIVGFCLPHSINSSCRREASFTQTRSLRLVALAL